MATTTRTRTRPSRAATPHVGPVNYSVTTTVSGDGAFLLQTLNEIRDYYHKVAHESVTKYLGPDKTKYNISVDGVPGAPIESASLVGSGVIASNVTSSDAVEKAFNAAMAHLNALTFTKSGRSTGTYKRLFTVRVNGKEVGTPDWKNFTAKSNVQIYSKARYASPLESIHKGRLLLGARNAAAKIPGVNASFTYGNPKNYGQIEEKARRTGKPFIPLAVPIVEIGSNISNVTNHIGNIEMNLERGRKRDRKNLVERKILKAGLAPRGRELPKRVKRVAPKPGGNRRK